MKDIALLDTTGIVFMSAYLVSLLLIGIAGRLARKEDSLADFYLSGRGMGLFVLFLTLYATQYSGNTLIGMAGKSYRQGYTFLVSVTFMMSVIGAYLIYAPKLHRLSKKQKYITIGDYIEHRYGSPVLTTFITIVCIITVGSYILTNLKAIGYIVEATTGGRVTFVQGIITLSLIMVIYETLGGMRSVAWTDAIQGILLIAGCLFIFCGIEYQYGGISAVAEKLISSHSDMWHPPDFAQKRIWLSTIIIIFFGISIYPQAIQRIYAAKDAKTLKRSFQIMIFMPFVTTFFLVIAGMVGMNRFPGLDKRGSEEITMLLLNDMAMYIPGAKYFIILFLSAAVAAIMSTVDSALLAISSLFTQDIYRRIWPTASQSHLTGTGKIFSWSIMACMAYFATSLPQTIWRLTEMKLEVLCQVAPAIFLGLHFKSIRGITILGGLSIGISVTLFIMFSENMGVPIVPKPWGIHAGVWGLIANFLIVGYFSYFKRSPVVC
ncbi:sodium solute symporter family protein [Candidatus Scalindua japonica]|uniref:Sodium solute symporter family protein n=1 Tax=Candidatus Scalindua japonica TaxID=1284222 RepID=A0A286TUR2_9BACT|nr:sodium:solute symporter family protein [Candidatus Scalindua japonica]GAX59629.1 sodium solute symporter family protein [Candidatus Scalindua japonica]